MNFATRMRHVAGVLALGLCVLVGCTTQNASAGNASEPSGEAVSDDPVTQAGVRVAELGGWDVVIAPDAPAHDRAAAELLRDTIGQATGKTPALVESADAAALTRPRLLVGPKVAGIDVSDLGDDDIRYVVSEQHIAIAGGPRRGTVYAVNQFLQDALGVRFLTKDHTHVPAAADQVISLGERVHRPPFWWRMTFSFDTPITSVDSSKLIWTMANPVVESKDIPEAFSGQPLVMHSFSLQVPTAKYGKDHPEWYALWNGKRLNGPGDQPWDHYYSSPCPTEPGLREEVTRLTLERLDKDPGLKLVSVAYGDNGIYCQCERCQKINDAEGTPAAALLTLVNHVAERVAAKHPETQVATLAYWSTRHPPKTLKAHPNVIVMLCPIEIGRVRPMTHVDGPEYIESKKWLEDFEGWGKVTDTLYVWWYNSNYEDFYIPFPNLRTIEGDTRYFAQQGVKGIFSHTCMDPLGEMIDVRAYMTYRLMWDPSLSGQELMDEFIDLHYGPAAAPIRRYIERIHDEAEKANKNPTSYGRGDFPRPTPRSNFIEFMGLERAGAQQALADMDEAMKLAGDDAVLRDRVERMSIGPIRWSIEPAWHASADKPLTAEQIADQRPRVREFFRILQKHGSKMESWNTPIEVTQARLRKNLGMAEGEAF